MLTHKPNGDQRMPPLHIVQAGRANGDKAWLDNATIDSTAKRWIMPKHAEPGDDVVFYMSGFGFYATGIVDSKARPRIDWPRRFGGAIKTIRRIYPAVSLLHIRRHVPELTWANYPRSITTPVNEVAASIRKLIQRRRKLPLPDLDEEAIDGANLEELRHAAIWSSKRTVVAKMTKSVYRSRSLIIARYVRERSRGFCEGCGEDAPFVAGGVPYLEPHHTKLISEGGPDHPAYVIALCPNCHRRVHHGDDGDIYNTKLIVKLKSIEKRCSNYGAG